MSTSETVILESNVCPCGHGKILKHVTTQDNPWSSADISYELSCETCAANWVLDQTGIALVSRHAAAKADAANEAWRLAGQRLHAVVEKLVNDYFTHFAAQSKKAEWQEMHRLDIYVGTYRNYLQDKRNKQQAGKIAYGLRNRPWLTALAAELNSETELNQLIATWDARKNEWEEAARAVKRWPVLPKG